MRASPAIEVMRLLASNWRLSGIVSARAGAWLTVITWRGIAATGISGQRLNQLLDDPYGRVRGPLFEPEQAAGEEVREPQPVTGSRSLPRAVCP
jgi:hypothetical protein